LGVVGELRPPTTPTSSPYQGKTERAKILIRYSRLPREEMDSIVYGKKSP
jgi:hypothetical protein